MKPLTIGLLAAYTSFAPGAAPAMMGADLKPQTVAAFDRYVRLVESRMDDEVRRPDGFLFLDTLDEARRRAMSAALRRGDVVIESRSVLDKGKAVPIPDGRVHHWIGLAFMPGVRLGDAVRLLQDYDHHAEIYKPAVQRSKILAHDGDTFRVFLRFTQTKVITVTVDTENEAEFVRAGEDRVYSRIRSTRIAEVTDAGTDHEREKPVGHDGGYLWRLNTYWRFLERDGGTYIQCESVTLTRDIPFGVGWLVGPFVDSIPRESLTFTMQRTREILTGKPGR